MWWNPLSARVARSSRLKKTGLVWPRRVALAAVAAQAACGGNLAPVRVSFSQSSPETSTYDFVEVSAEVGWPRVGNPFVDAELTGLFETKDGKTRWRVEGFCDAPDGSVFRIRFSPPKPGDYRYAIEYKQRGTRKAYEGTFRVIDKGARGPIRIDAVNPYHFVWEGTGEHYFFHGTTAYWLFGWNDLSVIDSSLDRLHRLKVNRVRVTIAGRPAQAFGEPVLPRYKVWSPYVTPWPAEHAEDVYHPGFDYSRFDVSYWQKIEHGLRAARERNMIISLALDMNDSQTHPEARSDDERRYVRYAIARFGAFSNITWDVGDDLDGYRDLEDAEWTGNLLHQVDPYQHLITTHYHSFSQDKQPRSSPWVGFVSFQNWSRTQHEYMLKQRKTQEALGRIIPQTNEEYGYEDHYPWWAPQQAGADSPDVLRRMAWEISMAAAYGTTGETAKRGTNVWPNTGGGWINGRGDSTMTMLQGYAHMVDFFTSFDWWKANPHDELVTKDAYCLAEPGRNYALYLPSGGTTTVQLASGRYAPRWFNPLTGAWINLPVISGGSWTSPPVSDASHDWAILLQRVADPVALSSP